MSPQPFTAAQSKVLVHISAGSTLKAAAEAAGVHRNTILHWRRNLPGFRAAWEQSHYDQMMQVRDEVLPLAPLAVTAIREILENPAAPPALRLRAALAVHKIISTPPPAQPERDGIELEATLPEAAAPMCALTVEIPAQSCTTPLQTKAVPQRIDCAPPSKTVHSPAPSTSKTGRNEPCPCRSGRKFKHCCSGKAIAA